MVNIVLNSKIHFNLTNKDHLLRWAMKTEQRFGLKMRNFEFFESSSNIQAPDGGLLGENNKTTSYACTIHFCIKWYQDCKKTMSRSWTAR